MTGDRHIPDWPAFDASALDELAGIKYSSRKNAMEMRLLDKKKPCEVQEVTGIRSSEQKRILERCQSLHDDGRIWGYRGLKQNVITKYERRSTEDGGQVGGRGKSGLFQELLDANGRELHRYLSALYWKGEEQKNGSYKLLSPDDIHSRLLSFCQKKNIPLECYPFSTVDQGRRSTYRFLKEIKLANQAAALARDYGEDIATAFISDSIGTPIRKSRSLFGSVQLDGHQLDCDADVEIEMPSGMPLILPIEMIYTVDLVTEHKSIIFGHSLALSGNYNQEDVQRTLASSMGIRRVGEFHHCDYLPHHYIPELKWLAFDQATLDRFMAHQGREIRLALLETHNARILYDMARIPRKRPHIEAIFTALEKRGISRLPSAHKPGGVRVSKNKSRGAAKRACIRWQDLEAIIQETYRDRLLSPSRSIEGRTPLEYLQSIVKRDLPSIRPVPLMLQERINILRKTFEVTVRGDLKKGRRPHANIVYGDYRGLILSRSGAFVDKQITCIGDIDDARVLEAFIDGRHVDRLQVQSPWNTRQHTFETRKKAMAAFRKNGIKVKNIRDGVGTYEELLRGKIANPSRGLGKEIARLHREKDESARVVPMPAPMFPPENESLSPPRPLRTRKTVRFI